MSEAHTKAAISLTTAAGEVFQSHPLGLFYADSVSGKMAQIGSIQSSVGTLYPPNVIVFSNVLSGVRADLMLVWARNGYEQNLVLKQAPPKPESFGLSSSSTALQLWSAMDSCPVPQEQRPVLLDSGLEDHILTFSNAWFPVGAAFVLGNTPLPSSGHPAQIHLIKPGEPGTLPVAKSLVTIAGEQVLIEEINYTDLLTMLKALPQASATSPHPLVVELAKRGELLPRVPVAARLTNSIQIASTPYSPSGVVLDYVTLDGGAYGYTFASGTTYFLDGSFSIGPGGAVFQQGACIKFAASTSLVLNGGPVSFPTSGSKVVFTSKDDNGYGQQISGSTAVPSYAANPAIWMYYFTSPSIVQNAQIRWAIGGIEYDESSGVTTTPSLASSVFQNCEHGVNDNIPSDSLTLSGDSYCNVGVPVYLMNGRLSGAMTFDCGVVSVAMVNDTNRDSSGLDPSKNSQSECSFVLPDSSTVVAAFWNTHMSEYALGIDAFYFPQISSPRSVSWSTSMNSGATFIDNGPILPSSPSPAQGDAGDPVMAYDPNGTIYLLVNPSREPGTFNGLRLWASTDKGTSFSLVNNNVPGGLTSADKPMIKVASPQNLYVSGRAASSVIWPAHSGNGGLTWDPFVLLDTTSALMDGDDIAIAPDGTVYVFWLQSAGAGPYVNKLRYAWKPAGGAWSTSLDFGITLNSVAPLGSGQLLRSKTAPSTDYFDSNGFPRLAIANGCVYVVYADLPYAGSSADRGDIWLAEALINANHSLTLNGIRKVNNDGTTTDQWNGSIAASWTELFIGYYSRQNDANNSYIMAYGAKANVANGLASATFDCFPVSPTAFQPLFAGTSAPVQGGWAYDPVWPQTGVCLDQYARYTSCPGGTLTTDSTYIHFSADDYTWAAADSSYFYFAWCDRSRTFGTPPNTRPDADVKFARIKQ